MYQIISEQLRNYCDCVDFDDVKETDIQQLVQLISTLTCWREDACGTFLSSDRYERFDIVYERDCLCNHAVMRMELRYKMIQEGTIEVNLVSVDGVKRIKTKIDEDDIYFDEYENALYVDLIDHVDTCKCSCDKPMYLEILYVAGYEQLPDCLLPVFCDYLQYIMELNKCACEQCEGCGESGDISISESNDTQEGVGFDIRRNIITSYSRELGYISLCGVTHLKGAVI